MKQKVAHHGGVKRGSGPNGVGGDMFGRKAEQEIRVDEPALVAHLFVLAEADERLPVRRPRLGQGPRSFPVGNPSLPIELGSASLLEGGNQPAQLRVYRAAVIALV